jgi:hypothetical protein
LFEVILVDDESKEVFSPQSRSIQCSNYKKTIEFLIPSKMHYTAMQLVKAIGSSPLMLMCGSRKLVIDIDNYIQNHEVSMIAGAVTYDCSNSFLHQFQQLDFKVVRATIVLE